MKRSTIDHSLLAAFFMVVSVLFAQQPLPKGLTEAENAIIANYSFRSNGMTDPPEGPVRTMAEWEEVEYLVITWQPNFDNILRQIVEAAIQECKIIITTQNEASVANYLTNNGIDLTNITFMDENWDSIWIRDYAGNTIYSDDVGERALTDWIYNRPRPNDDVMPSAHADLLGLPIYITDTGTNDLVNTGGNFMSDGLGTAFASELILEENEAGNPYGVSPKTEAEIDDIMEAYMGIDRYIKMETLPYDAIHHIDMHMKLLDEETILVSQYPEGVADGPQIEANIEYVLSNFQSSFGTPYKIEWMAAPPSAGGNYPDTGGYYRTYTNAVFINGTVLVPTYRPEVDDPALAQWQELLPGYNIVGIDVDNPGENLIALFGAIHCITHTVGVEDPLWIVHQPVDQALSNSNVTLDAMIKHISGVAGATVYWRQAGEVDYNALPMSDAGDDQWTVDLAIPSDDIDIEYYIEAEANSGKVLARPLVAPDGYWTIAVGELSIDDWANNNISAPYPNPTNGVVNFAINQIQGAVQVKVFNMLGQQLMDQQIEQANGIFSLDLRPDWSGTLLVVFDGEFGTIRKRVQKF